MKCYNIANSGLARLNTNGSLDNTFTCSGLNGVVNSLALVANDKILVGGNFTAFSSKFFTRLARLNADGTADTTFTNPNIADNVNTILVTNNANNIVAGSIGYAYLNSDGLRDVNYRNYTGFNSTVDFTVFQNDGKLLVGGFFTLYKNKTQNRLIRFNSDLTVDTSFNIGSGFNDRVRVIAVQPDNSLLVGGDFSTYNGVSCGNIVRLLPDGTLDATFNGVNVNSNVRDIKILANEQILVSWGTRITRLSKNGAIDYTFDASSLNGGVNAMHVQNDGKIIIGGYLTSYGATPLKHLARLNANGSLDTTFQGSQFDDKISVITPLSNGKLVVGGTFTKYDTTNQSKIAIVDTDGVLDTSFVSTNVSGDVKAIKELPNGKLLVGGTIFYVNSVGVNRIALFNTNGSLNTDVSFGAGLSNTSFGSLELNSLAVKNNEVILGGSFSSYKTNNSAHLTRLNFNAYLSVADNVLPSTSFMMYPNPVNDVVTIATEELFDFAVGKIYTSNGALVLQNKLSKTVNAINVGALAKGVYILKIETNKGVSTKRFIKN